MAQPVFTNPATSSIDTTTTQILKLTYNAPVGETITIVEAIVKVVRH